VTRGELTQRAGSPGLKGGGAAAAVQISSITMSDQKLYKQACDFRENNESEWDTNTT